MGNRRQVQRGGKEPERDWNRAHDVVLAQVKVWLPEKEQCRVRNMKAKTWNCCVVQRKSSNASSVVFILGLLYPALPY